MVALKDVGVGIADNQLISGLDWNILPGERWAIVGENGCGKSTLLKSVTVSLGSKHTAPRRAAPRRAAPIHAT